MYLISGSVKSATVNTYIPKVLLTIVNCLPETQPTLKSDRRKSPCEMIIWDVLPSIRAAIAEELVKRDLPQKEISKLLGITPPAVSQYISKKRGYNIEFGEEIKASISKLAEDLLEKKVDNPVERICEICRMMRDDEITQSSTRCE
jgi:predicted transcriptional regulator